MIVYVVIRYKYEYSITDCPFLIVDKKKDRYITLKMFIFYRIICEK